MNRRRILAVLFVAFLIGSLGNATVPIAEGSSETEPAVQTGIVEMSESALRTGTFDRASSLSNSHRSDDLIAAKSATNQLTRTTTFSLRPADSGQISAEMAFNIPDQIVELKTAIPADATVIEANGFEAAGDGNYSWNGDTVNPSVTLSLSVNRTGTYHLKQGPKDLATETETGFTFVDTGNWAISPVPPASVWWSAYRSSPDVTFVRQTAVSGPGVAGDRMVFLGDHYSETRTVDGQSITLVVPDAATLEPSTDSILDSIEGASPYLPEGSVDRSLVIAAPTSVDWGPYGLADQTDTWVRADQEIDVPGNVWLHEFVHLRQDFRTEPESQWIREAMPEYYATYLSLEQGRIDFGSFSDQLERGTYPQYEETVLSRPDTWGSLANYAKGALVYGTIDRRIRVDSDGSYTARNVFDALNERDELINQAFMDTEIAAFVEPDTVSELNEYITTTQTPEMWSRVDHQTAFGTTPPDIITSVEDPVVLSGPYRNRSVEVIPTMVPGERVSIPVTVTNEGEESGTYDLQLSVDGTVVANTNGSLTGGQTETVTLAHTFTEMGEISLAIGSYNWTVTVSEPASPSVSKLRVSPDELEPGSALSISISVANNDTRPATGTITPTVDGTPITTWTFGLDVNETVERTVRVNIDESGEHNIAAGSKTKLVTVVEPSRTTTAPESGVNEFSPTTTRTESGSTPTSTSGFTLFTALVALLILSGRSLRQMR